MARRRRKSPRRNARNQQQSAPEAQGAEPLPAAEDEPVADDSPIVDDASLPIAEENQSSSIEAPMRVLAVFPDTAVLRLIRESMTAFTGATVDTTPDAAFGFEMAMQRDYRMFFFGVDLPVLGGERLYDFIAKAYAHVAPERRLIPAVVYLTLPGQQRNSQELMRDARVKGVISCPFEISRLLKFTEGILPAKQIGS